jgi:hypothetical protein
MLKIFPIPDVTTGVDTTENDLEFQELRDNKGTDFRYQFDVLMVRRL